MLMSTGFAVEMDRKALLEFKASLGDLQVSFLLGLVEIVANGEEWIAVMGLDMLLS